MYGAGFGFGKVRDGKGRGREGKRREGKGREGKGREGKGRAPDSSGRDTVDFCSTAVRPVWEPWPWAHVYEKQFMLY